jgi:hypothetical protein
MYVLWAIALTLLISTGLFCWLVVVPMVEAHFLVEALPSPHGKTGGVPGDVAAAEEAFWRRAGMIVGVVVMILFLLGLNRRIKAPKSDESDAQ